MSVNNRISKMVDDDTSFALLRANPKLTGNIKVVVDSDENLYLDTFKVSLGLSQFQYRHISINPSEYYGRTIMSKMKDMPPEDMYKVEDTCFNLFAMADGYDGQYYDKYNYGVRTNFDRLYKENFALLAPICIRKTLPDFFLIFKITNNDIIKGNNTSILNYNNVKFVKSFDMRSGTNIGKYIRNILDNARTFVGDVYTGYSYDHFNGYNGISLDRGVVACMYESTVDERMFNNQVAMNNWYTLGFERNHMVSKDIINLEFMFNDTDEELFSNPSYFGVYVRLNGEDKSFSCIKTETSSGITNNIFSPTPSGLDFKPSDFPNVIYGVSTPYGFKRLTNNISKEPDIASEYCKKPSSGIITSEILDTSYVNDNTYYVSFNMREPTTPGEHYRVIDKTSYNVYEVIIRGGNYDTDISEAEPLELLYGPYSDRHTYTIHRIFVNNIPKRESGKTFSNSEISRQSKLIARAFNTFPSNLIDAYTDDDHNVSILYRESQDLLFFWVCEPGKTDSDPTYDPIRIFGIESIHEHQYPRLSIDPLNSINYQYTKLYFPIGYEYLGERYLYGTKFFKINSTETEHNILINNNITDYVMSYGTVLYMGKDSENKEEYYVFDKENIKIEAINNIISNYDEPIHTEQAIRPCVIGFGSIKSYMVKIEGNEPYGSRLQLFENTPLNAGVCSIFNIKDFYHDVIDDHSRFEVRFDSATEEYQSTIESIPSSTPGEYSTQNKSEDENSRGVKLTQSHEEYLHNYIDMYDTFDIVTNDDTGKFSLDSSSDIASYLYNLQNNAHYNLDVSLIEPYCCKWRGLSTDHYGMRMRVMESMLKPKNGYDTMVDPPYIVKNDASSYFIPKSTDNYIGFIPTSSPDGYKYILNEPTINDILSDNSKSIDDTLYTTSNPYNKFSKVYMYGNNEIEFVSAGVKIRLSSTGKSLLNLSKYVGYSSILKVDKTLSGIIMLFVDETTEQMEVVVYAPNTSTLSDISRYKENLMAKIKHDENDYTDITYNQGLRIDFIEPYQIDREDIKYKETTFGSVHPVYCTPVVVDMFDFKNTYNDINSYFDRNFNYTNLSINSIKNIKQTWMQKVPDINNVIQQSSGIRTNEKTYIESREYTASHGDGINEIKILDPNKTYWATSNTGSRVQIKVPVQTIKTRKLDLTKSLFSFNSPSIENPLYAYHLWQSDKHFLNSQSDNVYDIQQSGTSGSFKLKNFKNELDETDNNLYIYNGEKFYRRSNCLIFSCTNPTNESYLNHGSTLYYYFVDFGTGETHEIKYICSLVSDGFKKSGSEYIVKYLDSNNTFPETWYTNGPIVAYESQTRADSFKYDYQAFLSNAVFTCGQPTSHSAEELNDMEARSNYDYFTITSANIDQKPTKADLYIKMVDPENEIPTTGNIYTEQSGGETVAKYDNAKGSYVKKTVKTSVLILTSTSALTLYKDMSITKGYWYQYMCRLFTKYGDYDNPIPNDHISGYPGYVSGYEKNCYIASRGITRYGSDNNKSNLIIIDDWTDSIIEDDVTKSVTLDITSAIFRKIKSFNGFQSSWRLLELETDELKTYQERYIENSIIKNIRINNKNVFKLYANIGNKSFKFKTTKPSENDINLFTEVSNVQNTLVYENNRYYMKIYDLMSYTYYAEFYIEL